MIGPVTHFDVVGQDGHVCYRHDRMLGELLGVVGACTPLENDPVVSTQHPEAANLRTQTVLQVRFQAYCLFRGTVICM